MYTEEDLRKAFRAGIQRGYFDGENNYFDAPFDEDEYIESLNPSVEEDKISFTYSFLHRKLDWLTFYNLTGTNE